MPVSGRELSSLDFGNLIGGPLNAVIEAQAKSAITSATFIREVGFKENGELVTAKFKYDRENDNGNPEKFELTLPFITMLPIPYIRVERATIDFNAKITSTTERSSESTFKQDVDASAKGRWWFLSASVTSKTSYQKKSSSSDKEERSYDLRVSVEATNDDLPAGTERVLTILENCITENSQGITGVKGRIAAVAESTLTLENNPQAKSIASGWTSRLGTVTGVDEKGVITLDKAPPASEVGQMVLFEKPGDSSGGDDT